MPYKKRYKSNGRPGYKRCGKMVWSDAAKALALAKHLKTIVNVEFKNHDVQATAAALSATPGVTQLTNIAQGDTTNSRDGSSLKIVSISFKYILRVNGAATNTQVRLILIHDKQTNQAIFAPADFLQDTSINDNLVSQRNLDNGHRFTVIMDRVFNLTATGKGSISGSFYKKLNLKLRYDNAAAAITSLTQSSLALMLITNEASNVPSITHSIRLRYVDN